jgi:hypothetical protein
MSPETSLIALGCAPPVGRPMAGVSCDGAEALQVIPESWLTACGVAANLCEDAGQVAVQDSVVRGAFSVSGCQGQEAGRLPSKLIIEGLVV